MRHHLSGNCLHRGYRLSCPDFDALWARAGGACELCGKVDQGTPSTKLVIDHDGRYGDSAVRGLICSQCNSLMRFVDAGLKKDPRATSYMRRSWFLEVAASRYEAQLQRKRRNDVSAVPQDEPPTPPQPRSVTDAYATVRVLGDGTLQLTVKPTAA